MVVDLIPWTEYEFRVIATNTLGTGEPSSPSAKERTMDAGKSHGPHAGSLEVNKIYLPSRDVLGVARKRSWKTSPPPPKVPPAAVGLSIHHFIIALFTCV